MRLIDWLEKSINEFGKAEYTDKLKVLDVMEDDLSVIHVCEANRQRVADIQQGINRNRASIHEEKAAR